MADQKIRANNLDQRARLRMGLPLRAHAEVFLLASLIYLGLADDQTATFVDVDVDTVDPAKRARRLLAEHRSCQHVEVWREERCIYTVSRERLDPTP
jgi:hypothetical protein